MIALYGSQTELTPESGHNRSSSGKDSLEFAAVNTVAGWAVISDFQTGGDVKIHRINNRTMP